MDMAAARASSLPVATTTSSSFWSRDACDGIATVVYCHFRSPPPPCSLLAKRFSPPRKRVFSLRASEHQLDDDQVVQTSTDAQRPLLSMDHDIRGIVCGEVSKRNALRRLDEELAIGNETKALMIVSALQDIQDGHQGFGRAAQVPQKVYTIEDLRLNKIDASRFLSPVDSTLGEVRRNLQLAAAIGGIVGWQTLELSPYQVLFILLALTVIAGIDLVANGGGIESLLLDTAGRFFSKKYSDRVAQHEAGHFLIAYLLGVLPKSYTLSSLDAFRQGGSLNIQAGTVFADFQFQEEVKSGKLSSKTLDKFSCIALAGVASEYLLFGLAEGGLADIQQLDNLLKSLNFTQKKADSQVRWAALNVVTILRRHKNILLKLAMCMMSKKSVGECIEVIEYELADVSEI